MKIYFSASLHQRDQFGDNYKTIIKTLKKMGHKVQHEHITDPNIDDRSLKKNTAQDREEYYQQVLKWINQADLVIIEASYPSTLNIGHEISIALEKNKPVVVLYKKGHESFLLQGLKSDKLIMLDYAEDKLVGLVKQGVDYAKEQSDTRFNFFISPEQLNFLDKIAKERRIPRSVFLRRLIEADMDKNPDYTI